MTNNSSRNGISKLVEIFGKKVRNVNGNKRSSKRSLLQRAQLTITTLLAIAVLCQSVAPIAIGATKANRANRAAKKSRAIAQRNTPQSISPTRANQGQRLTVTIKGINTRWAEGKTRVSFGGEISVGGALAGEFGPVTVADDKTITAEITISPTAALGLRSINITTEIPGSSQPDVEELKDGFTVAAIKSPGAAGAIVSLVAGFPGGQGNQDGKTSQARFRNPAGLAVSADGTIYVADSGNHRIRAIAVDGTVTTLAGSGLQDFADGQLAHFNNPQGIAIGPDGAIYVADTDNHRIRKIAGGVVSTVAGDGRADLVDGSGDKARFNSPRGVAVAPDGTILVADSGNSAVRVITRTGEVRTLTGNGTIGSNDSPDAKFNGISGVAIDGDNIYIYLADGNNHRIRKLDSTGTVITVAGADRGFADGRASEARFAEPSGVAVDGDGSLVVADTINSLIRSINPALAQSDEIGAVTTIAGSGERGTTNGPGNVARFNTPRGVAVTTSSAIIIADTGNHTIRKIMLPPAIGLISPNKAAAEAVVTIEGERFDARAPEKNMVRFARQGGSQTNATVVAATSKQLIVVVPADAATGKVTVQTEGGTATSPADFEVGASENSPIITDFNPRSAEVGQTVTLSGQSLKASTGDSSVSFAGANGTRLPAFIAGITETEVKVTVPNGVVTGVIELRNAAGKAVTTEPFTVKATDEFEITAAPTSVQAMQNTSATFMISMSSSKDNFKQLAKLDVTGLPGKARGKFTPPQIAPGESSTLEVDLNNSNVAPGNYSFKVTGTVNVQGNEMVREVTLSLTVMAGGTTSLRGRVLSIDDEPVPGATVSMDGKSAVTDAAGVFILSGITPGTKRALKVDGKTASTPGRTYPTVVEPAKVLANQSNSSPYIFYLPIVDTQHEININPNQDTFITTPRVPGLKMTIPAAAKPTNRDGSPATRVSITPVPPDRLPSPLPAGVKVPMIYTNQPGGAISKEPMPVTFPNLGGDDPGTKLPVYAFNHDEVEWQIIGYGIVSRDGKTIEPDVNPETGKPYGLMDFSWFGVGTGTTNIGPINGCPISWGHRPVDYFTGVKIEEGTDISFGSARGGVALSRIYTSDLDVRPYSGDFGRGVKHNYEIFLTGTFQSGGSGRIVMPDDYNGRLFSYDHTEVDGTLIFKSTVLSDLLGDTIKKLSNGNLEYRTSKGIIMAFNSNGRLTSITDPNGNSVTLTYNNNKLASITDPVGRSITFTYNTNNHISRATDPIGQHWDYTYDYASRISTVTDPLGKTVSYTYSGSTLTKVTDKRGNTYKEIIYGGSTGNVSEQRFADGSFERYTNENLTTTITQSSGRTKIKRFNAAGYVIEETDELGQHSRIKRDIITNLPLEVIGHCGCSESVKTYDSRGNVLTVTDELGQTMSYEYESTFNNVTKVIDKLNKETTFTYDSHGNLLSSTNALNQTTSYTYDQYGQMTSMTDALNHTWTFEYDNEGNLISQKDPYNNEMTMEYDGLGRMTAIEDSLQRRSEMAYDAMGRILTRTDPNSTVTSYTYDGNGNLIITKNALNHEWKMAYDAKNRLISKSDPINRIIRMEYNSDDELVTLISPSNRIIRYTYTARGQKATITDFLGGIVYFTYDKDDNLVTISDQRGKITSYSYDEINRVTKVVNPSGLATITTYNAMNNILTFTDRIGRNTSFTYDALHRPYTVTYSDATITYSYDAAGRYTSISDSQSGDVSWTYDNANRLLSETTSQGTVSYTYNSASQRASMTVGSEPVITYGYDTAGRPITITQGTEVFTYSYDTISRRSTLERPNGVTTTYSYDSVNRLTRLKHQKGSSPALEDLQYTYNSDSEINSITSLYATPSLPIANNSISSANDVNRLTQFGSTTYSFNNMGQTTSKSVTGIGTTNYEWDHRGRLTKVTLPNSQEIIYSYDALGRRKSRATNGTTTEFLYDRNDVVLDSISGVGSVKYVNGFGIDEKLKQTTTSGNSYFITNHLQSVIGLLDSSGTVTERADYDPFGNSTGSSTTRYGFTGRERDSSTGLIYYRARWYDSEQGRFISEDPISFKGGLNFYSYVSNNPVNSIDPLGLVEWGRWGARICNRSNKCIIAGKDTGSGSSNTELYKVLKPGQCTDPSQDWDYAYYDGLWIKCVNMNTCYISIDGRYVHVGYERALKGSYELGALTGSYIPLGGIIGTIGWIIPRAGTAFGNIRDAKSFSFTGFRTRASNPWEYFPAETTPIDPDTCKSYCECNNPDNQHSCDTCKQDCMSQRSKLRETKAKGTPWSPK